MEKTNFLYEGKAKQIYGTSDLEKIIVYYKDDATAFNAQKKGVVSNKGILNNKITEFVFNFLGRHGVPTHFIKRLNEREQLCQKVSIIPLEVIVRNVWAGSSAKKLGIEEGKEIKQTIFEICYKKDELGDPLINDYHAVALGLVSVEDLKEIYSLTGRINDLLKGLFDERGIILVDFKIEFGRTSEGKIILADEISPDTCRLWEKTTLKKLDKDRFRRDLGEVEEAYIEIFNRLIQSY